MTGKQLRTCLRRLGVKDLNVVSYEGGVMTFNFTATVDDGEDSNVLLARVVGLLSECDKANGGHGLRLAGPVQRSDAEGRP